MRYSSVATAAVGALLVSMMPARAQTPVVWGGPYGGVSLGSDWGMMPGSATILPTGPIPRSDQGFTHRDNATITGGGQAGYNFQLFNNWVLGVEGDIKGGGPSYTSTVTGTPPAGGFAPGTRFQTSSDYNASIRLRAGYAYDRFLLYGTGGVAFAPVTVKATYTAATPGGATGSVSNSTTLIGGTYGGGLEYAVTPNISVAGEYRHTDYGADHMGVGPVPTALGLAPVRAKVDLHDDVALLKVNYRWGAPPPPPPPMPAAMPAPPPEAPKVFIVFFDWDKDVITPEGQQIIQQAADAYKSGAPVQLQVTGYTDRSGSPAYNQRLSERRANNVAKALVALGVPRNEMAVSGRGENDNRVPTAAGVREPQNRRVEITAP